MGKVIYGLLDYQGVSLVLMLQYIHRQLTTFLRQIGLLKQPKESQMKRKSSAMPSKAVKPSYEEPMRPVKPNSNSDKGKPQDQGKGKSKKK